jgi:hypothetical protein
MHAFLQGGHDGPQRSGRPALLQYDASTLNKSHGEDMFRDAVKIKVSYAGSHVVLHSEEGTPCFCRSSHAIRCVELAGKATMRRQSLAGPRGIEFSQDMAR